MRMREGTEPQATTRLGALLRAIRQFIVNWDEVSRNLLHRARRELGGPAADEAASALLDEIQRHAGVADAPAIPRAPDLTELLVPVHLRKDGVDIRTFSTIMTFGTPQDVTLQELRVETFFPADPASNQILCAMGGQPVEGSRSG